MERPEDTATRQSPRRVVCCTVHLGTVRLPVLKKQAGARACWSARSPSDIMKLTTFAFVAPRAVRMPISRGARSDALDEPSHNPVPFTNAQANRRKSTIGEL